MELLVSFADITLQLGQVCLPELDRLHHAGELFVCCLCEGCQFTLLLANEVLNLIRAAGKDRPDLLKVIRVGEQHVL